MRVKTRFEASENVSKSATRIEKNVRRMNKVAQAGFKASAKTAKLFGGAMKGVALGAKAAAAAAVGVVGAVSAAVIKTAELGDEAAKTGRRMGLSAEALQELRFAADRQGVSSQLLGSSLTALQKRVGELKNGTGALYGFLKKTGDKALARQLKAAKGTEEAFAILTTKVNQIKDPMKKAAFASAAFSRAGIDMIKMMEAGNDGIADLRKEAVKYGAVISNEAAGNSEIFLDALTNMQTAFGGVGKAIGSTLMPALTPMIQGFADFMAANRGLLSGVLTTAFTQITTAIKALAGPAMEIFGAIQSHITNMVDKFKLAADKAGLFGRIKNAIKALVPVFKTLFDIAKTVFDVLDKIGVIDLMVAGFGLLADGIVFVSKAFVSMWAKVKPIIDALDFSAVKTFLGFGAEKEEKKATVTPQPNLPTGAAQPAFAGGAAPPLNVNVQNNINAQNIEVDTTVKAPGTSGNVGVNKF